MRKKNYAESAPPAQGERFARFGYGYQDRAATKRVLDLLRADIRGENPALRDVRLADLQAGRVDDFVLVTDDWVEGNSIKWSSDASAIQWADLVGADGLLFELAAGFTQLEASWNRKVEVRLVTNRIAARTTNGKSLIRKISVDCFLRDHWPRGPRDDDPSDVAAAWTVIADHTKLPPNELRRFVSACALILGYPEPPGPPRTDLDWLQYHRQFDSLHRAIATFITNSGGADSIPRDYLLDAIGYQASRSGLMHRFPEPRIPYSRNAAAAEALRSCIELCKGGYVSVVGAAGIGKSTLVQDILTPNDYPHFVPYYAFLPDGEGLSRDRGEALTFYQDVVSRLDRFFDLKMSLGISDIMQGRETLKRLMASASEQFAKKGIKTVLLIDGLDHVAREPSLTHSILGELPLPDEIPDGFVIVLSTQPQAIVAGRVPALVAHAVGQADRRVEIQGLTREEVHAILGDIGRDLSGEEKAEVVAAVGGNPLILTYLVNALLSEAKPSVDSAIRMTGRYDGDIETYYTNALASLLSDAQARHVLGLICRAAPTIPVAWLQSWPERAQIESLYTDGLAAFVREEAGSLYFIHNSLIAFLKVETRSKLPGFDPVSEEQLFYSELAVRCGQRVCADPLGRAKILHLLRAGKSAEVLATATSTWLREGIEALVPYGQVRAVVLAGLDAAWNVQDYGSVIRLVLSDFELSQRSSRTGPGELAESLLALGQLELGVNQIRSAGRLSVDDDVALKFSNRLWEFGRSVGNQHWQRVARSVFELSKPIVTLYGGEVVDTDRDREAMKALSAWADVMPFFEDPLGFISVIKGMTFAPARHRSDLDGQTVQCGLLYRMLQGSLKALHPKPTLQTLVREIDTFELPYWHFAALLRLARHSPELVTVEELWAARGDNSDADLDLALSSELCRRGQTDRARELVSTLAFERYDALHPQRGFGFTDLTFTVLLREMQVFLGLPEGEIAPIKDDSEEAVARVESVCRKIGILRGDLRLNTPRPAMHDDFRSILLFANIPAIFANYNWRRDYAVRTAKTEVYRLLFETAERYGPPALFALRDAVEDVLAGPAKGQLHPDHRRFFAQGLNRAGVLTEARSLEIGLSSLIDVEDDDPEVRQQACLRIAEFAHAVGNAEVSNDWLGRAGKVSAGAGSHKDYQMLHLSDWLVRSCSLGLDDRRRALLDHFLQAVEVAGGAGAEQAGIAALNLAFKNEPARARRLAVEIVDRDVLSLSMVLESALIALPSNTSPTLCAGILEELLSFADHTSPGKAAVACLRRVPHQDRIELAHRLMTSVRSNTLPSQRITVARDLQDALLEDGLGKVDLSYGLRAERDDSSYGSSVYGLSNGTFMTQQEMAALLSQPDLAKDWNPHPNGNTSFDWMDVLVLTTVQDKAHFDLLVHTFAISNHDSIQYLAWQCDRLLALGYPVEAQQLAEKAVQSARDGSWIYQLDGAKKVQAFRALLLTKPTEARHLAREAFGKDLAAGRMSSYFLLDSLPELYEFLDLAWPAEHVLATLEEYFDDVLQANKLVPQYSSLVDAVHEEGATLALCKLLVYLLAFPVVEIGVAARRCLARYVRDDGDVLADIFADTSCWDSVQLEYLLAAIDSGLVTGRALSGSVRPFVSSLNGAESLGVRSVARRICLKQGWQWDEINSQPEQASVIITSTFKAKTYDEAARLVDAEEEVAAQLYDRVLEVLIEDGHDEDSLASELSRLTQAVRNGYLWSDQRLAQWRRACRTDWWINTRSFTGREAMMRLIGRHALTGSVRPAGEEAYDALYPCYDSALELLRPVERPVEMRVLDWDFMDGDEKKWRSEEGADTWDHYPDQISGWHILGERSLFIRPEWDFPHETRFRGISPNVRLKSSFSLSTPGTLTYDTYISGLGQSMQNLTPSHQERQMLGSVYQWMAFNSSWGFEMDWNPSTEAPFQWEDANGKVMVKSIYWRDGWTQFKAPTFEALGEGWIVVASSEAVAAIRSKVGALTTHLWVERDIVGEKERHSKWYLCRDF